MRFIDIINNIIKRRNAEDGHLIPPKKENTTPIAITMGNTIFAGEYETAIRMGLEALKDNPHDPMIHINLMDAYFKGKDLSPEYRELSTKHARLAILYGHHTGYAEKRLAINLEKDGFFNQALQLYSLILDTPGFHFSKFGIGNHEDFEARRERTLKRLDKAKDTPSDKLFSESEIESIIDGIREADIKERIEKDQFKKRMDAWEKNLFGK